MEGQHARNSGKLVSLSESQIVDCDTNGTGCRVQERQEGHRRPQEVPWIRARAFVHGR